MPGYFALAGLSERRTEVFAIRSAPIGFANHALRPVWQDRTRRSTVKTGEAIGAPWREEPCTYGRPADRRRPLFRIFFLANQFRSCPRGGVLIAREMAVK